MVLVTLAGASAACKTTLAKEIARLLEIEYVPVQADECMGLPAGPERQNCFLNRFLNRVAAARERCRRALCIADNSLYSVAAYSLAAVPRIQADSVEAVVDLLAAAKQAVWLAGKLERHAIVVDAPPRIIRKRLAQRSRPQDALSTRFDIHLAAHERLSELALALRLPVVYNRRREEALRALAEILRRL